MNERMKYGRRHHGWRGTSGRTRQKVGYVHGLNRGNGLLRRGCCVAVSLIVALGFADVASSAPGDVIYFEDFEDGTANGVTLHYSADWTIGSGLGGSTHAFWAGGGHQLFTLDGIPSDNVAIEVDFTISSAGLGDFAVYCNCVVDPNTVHWLGQGYDAEVNPIESDTPIAVLMRHDQPTGAHVSLDSKTNTIHAAEEHHLRLERYGDEITVYLDGELFFSATDATYHQASIGFGIYSGGAVDNVKVTELPAPPTYWWGFDEAGSPYAEKTGTLSDATGVGTASATGICGNGVSFPQGTDAYVDLGVFNLPQTEGSVSMWIKPDDYGAATHYHVLTKGFDGHGPSGWAFALRTYDDGSFEVASGTAGSSYERSEPGAIQTGQWQHLVATWSSSGARFFVDGMEVPLGSNSGTVTVPPHATMPVALARWGALYYPEVAFKGCLDEVRVYDHALSLAEVRKLTALPCGQEGVTLTLTGNEHPDWGFVEVSPAMPFPYDPNAPYYYFEPNTVVTLTAVMTEPGKVWTGWQGDVDPGDALTNPLTITMDSDKEIITGYKCGAGTGAMLPLAAGLLGLFAVMRRKQ